EPLHVDGRNVVSSQLQRKSVFVENRDNFRLKAVESLCAELKRVTMNSNLRTRPALAGQPAHEILLVDRIDGCPGVKGASRVIGKEWAGAVRADECAHLPDHAGREVNVAGSEPEAGAFAEERNLLGVCVQMAKRDVCLCDKRQHLRCEEPQVMLVVHAE